MTDTEFADVVKEATTEVYKEAYLAGGGMVIEGLLAIESERPSMPLTDALIIIRAIWGEVSAEAFAEVGENGSDTIP